MTATTWADADKAIATGWPHPRATNVVLEHVYQSAPKGPSIS